MQKISDKESKDIRKLYKLGVSAQKLAKKYNISVSTIFRHINDYHDEPNRYSRDLGIDKLPVENINKGKNYKDYLKAKEERTDKGRIA